MAATGVGRSAPPTELRCEIVEDFSRLEDLSAEWNRLWETDAESEIFQKFEWVRAWWHAYQERINLFCPVVYEEDRLIGILPLGRTGSTLGFLGIPGSDFTDVICDETRTADVLNAVFSSLLQTQGWGQCELHRVPDHSRLVRHISDLVPDVRRNVQQVLTGEGWTMLLGENRDKIIDQLLRKPYLKRHKNKLEKAGRLVFHHIEDRDSALRNIEGLFQQHIRRRAMIGEASQFQDPDTRQFYRMMITQLDLRRELRFSVLELDDHAIAYHLGFEAKGKFVMYKPTFDIDSWEYSPGDVLLAKLLQYAKQRGVREYDFTIGGEQYKQHFANHARKIFTIALDLPLRRQPLVRLLRDVKLGFADNAEQSRTITWLRAARHKLIELRSNGIRGARKLVRTVRMGLPAQEKNVLWRLSNPSGPEETSEPACLAHQGTISNLADLALQHRSQFDADTLQNYRERLRSGDEYWEMSDDGKTYIVWLAKRTDKRTEVRVGGSLVCLDEPAVVLYDFSRVPASIFRPVVHPALLRAGINRARATGLPLYVCAWSTKGITQVLQKAGFHPCSRTELSAPASQVSVATKIGKHTEEQTSSAECREEGAPGAGEQSL